MQGDSINGWETLYRNNRSGKPHPFLMMNGGCGIMNTMPARVGFARRRLTLRIMYYRFQVPLLENTCVGRWWQKDFLSLHMFVSGWVLFFPCS